MHAAAGIRDLVRPRGLGDVDKGQIETYSRYLTGRAPGDPPPTLFEYLPDNALVFADESHVTIPPIGGLYRGDFRRKATPVS